MTVKIQLREINYETEKSFLFCIPFMKINSFIIQNHTKQIEAVKTNGLTTIHEPGR